MWLVAGGEPGAARFGQLVQRLRKEQKLTVDELAARAELSVATIRAIEQGRRAPSEESGVRLLRRLLPDDAMPAAGTSMSRGVPEALSFTDPHTGAHILLQFKARTAGDNRRWSADKPRAGESKTEAFIREFLSDPRNADVVDAHKRTLAGLIPVFERARSLVTEAASDADFGRVTRRLSTLNGLRLHRIEGLLDLWDRVDTDRADDSERDLVTRLHQYLDSYYEFPDEDLESST